MTSTPHTVFLVDDEASIREAVALVLEQAGFKVSSFAHGSAFLIALRERTPSAVLLDVHMPGMSGLDVLRELTAQKFEGPIIIISGQGDIPLAVQAIKNGATDFIEKPLDAAVLNARITDALAAQAALKTNRTKTPALSFPGHDSLTSRELDVLLQVTNGASNKEAGKVLGISPRTVEVHRARIMEKLNAKNAADLVRIVMKG